MTEAMGAGSGERTASRLGYRAGYYRSGLVTRIDKLELRAPRDRDGRFSTELFARFQRSEKALVSALTEMPMFVVRMPNRHGCCPAVSPAARSAAVGVGQRAAATRLRAAASSAGRVPRVRSHLAAAHGYV